MSEIDDKISQAWRNIYNTPDGQVAIGHLLADLGLYEEIQATGDAMSIGIAVGERNIAARIARHLGRTPQRYVEDTVEDINAVDAFLTAAQGD